MQDWEALGGMNCNRKTTLPPLPSHSICYAPFLCYAAFVPPRRIYTEIRLTARLLGIFVSAAHPCFAPRTELPECPAIVTQPHHHSPPQCPPAASSPAKTGRGSQQDIFAQARRPKVARVRVADSPPSPLALTPPLSHRGSCGAAIEQRHELRNRGLGRSCPSGPLGAGQDPHHRRRLDRPRPAPVGLPAAPGLGGAPGLLHRSAGNQPPAQISLLFLLPGVAVLTRPRALSLGRLPRRVPRQAGPLPRHHPAQEWHRQVLEAHGEARGPAREEAADTRPPAAGLAQRGGQDPRPPQRPGRRQDPQDRLPDRLA